MFIIKSSVAKEVAGGGVALICAISSLNGLKDENDDQTTGINIIRQAIEGGMM